MRRAALACVAGLALVIAGTCERSSRDAESLTSAGVQHLRMLQYDRAIRNFDRALALQPGLVVAWRNRAVAHKGKGDYELAVADYDQALTFAPADARLFTDRGAAYLVLNHFTRAIQDFDRAIGLKPDYAPALENRGRAHFILGNYAQAAADLQRGLVFDSTDVFSVLWLHLARQRLRQDDSEDFATHAAFVDTTQWPAPIVAHFLGRLSADSLRAIASLTDSTGQSQGCVVAFYAGQGALIAGDTATAAELFGETRQSCAKELTEHKAAVAELQRLGQISAPHRRSQISNSNTSRSGEATTSAAE